MQNQIFIRHQNKIEEHIRDLLKQYGLSDEEINLEELKKKSSQMIKDLLESYRQKNSKATELTPLRIYRSKGGIAFELEGVKNGKIPFHGAQDKALYLFFWKHSQEDLTSQDFLLLKEKDKRIRKSLLEIYKAIRGNKSEKEYLDLIDKIDDASLSQCISRINSAFKKKVSAEVLNHYTVKAGSNEARKVFLPAEYFRAQDPLLKKALHL